MTLYYVTYECFVVFVLFLIIKNLRFQQNTFFWSFCFFLLLSLNIVHAVSRFYFRWLYFMSTNVHSVFFCRNFRSLITANFVISRPILYRADLKIYQICVWNFRNTLTIVWRFALLYCFSSDAISWSSPGDNTMVQILNENVHKFWVESFFVLTYTEKKPIFAFVTFSFSF